MKQKTQGQCIGCKKMHTGAQGGKHLLKCEHIKEFIHSQLPSEQGYLLKVACAYNPNTYWMFVTVPLNAELSFLDSFLRGIWLECCGHLSMFDIEGISYCIAPETGESSMKKKIGKVLYPGLDFNYTYDFGSSTDLRIKVVESIGACSSEKVNMLMQNEAPVFTCEVCNSKESTMICSYCFETVCEQCVSSHGCVEKEQDTYMMLPLVNSPRTGMCAYGE